MTSDGAATYVIAGNVTEKGNKEGVRTSARFESIYNFTHISQKNIVVVDYHNHCLRLIDRSSNLTKYLLANSPMEDTKMVGKVSLNDPRLCWLTKEMKVS